MKKQEQQIIQIIACVVVMVCVGIGVWYSDAKTAAAQDKVRTEFLQTIQKSVSKVEENDRMFDRVLKKEVDPQTFLEHTQATYKLLEEHKSKARLLPDKIIVDRKIIDHYTDQLTIVQTNITTRAGLLEAADYAESEEIRYTSRVIQFSNTSYLAQTKAMFDALAAR